MISTLHVICSQNYLLNASGTIIIIIKDVLKNSNLRKEVGIAIKSKETSSQFESVRNSYVASYNTPACNYLLNHVVKCMYK